MKKKPTQTRNQKRITVPNSRLFPRRRIRIPARVQAASELWLEMFMGFCDGLLSRESTDDTPVMTHGHSVLLTDQARLLADAALGQFEDRWPDVKLEGTRD